MSARIYILSLNDMRSAHIEDVRAVFRSSNPDDEREPAGPATGA